jgi:RNA polymerase sigma factor (sigma-70 family)
MTISAQTYDNDKRFLWGLCYRMTGSAADADDIVQETFVKALEKPPVDLEAPLRPWLVKVALNLSRDQLRRRRRREYFGPWLPSPVLTEDDGPLAVDEPTAPDMSPGVRYDLQESISLAFLLALEALTPVQRAVLLLRDVFDYSTTETATTLDMTEINVKVTLHRARRIISSYDKDRAITLNKDHVELRRTLEQFLSYLAKGDVQALERLLTKDVVLVSDGGGEINALAAPMVGRAKVSRLITKLYEAYRNVTSTSLHLINGQPAVVIERSKVEPGHASFYTMHCEIDKSSQMRRLNFVFSPSKLSALREKVGA